MAFHANQIDAATNVTDIFAAGDIHYVILQAEVQSGKTGTFHAVARQMLDRGLVDRVYLLCGSNEITLRSQAHTDAKTWNADIYAAGTFVVCFRQDFVKTALRTDRTLLIIDESHMDQTQGQELSKFLGRYGLNLSGTLPVMSEQSTYILSVDATPYAELAAHYHGHSLPKARVLLEPGVGYYGPRQYEYAGHIHETFSIHANLPTFRELVDRYATGKWILIRTFDSDTIAALGRLDIPILHYTSERTEIAITRAEQVAGQQCLEDAPATTTIVLLKGRLRAGKVVPKHHIGMVWEDAAMPNTDTVVQGLLGRMCGYDLPATKPHIFVPKVIIDVPTGKCIKKSELQRHSDSRYIPILPRNGMNVVPGKVANAALLGEVERFQCPAIRLDMRGELDIETVTNNHHHTVNKERRRKCIQRLVDEFDEHIGRNPSLSELQKTEIRTRLASPDTMRLNMRHFNGSKQAGYLDSLIKAQAVNSVPTEHIPKFPDLTVCVVYPDCTVADAVAETVYCVFYTDAPSLTDVKPITSRIPTDNGESIFSIHDPVIAETTVAMTAICLSDEALASAAVFETQMREILTMWRRSVVTIDPCLHGHFYFSREAFAYIDATNNSLRRLLTRLEPEFDCKFKIVFGSGSVTSVRVERITWTMTA